MEADYLSIRRQIGARVRDARGGRTQLEMARLLNCDRATISNYETGTRPISAEDLVLIARYIGIPAGSLLESTDPETARENRALCAFRQMPDDYKDGAIAFLETVGRKVEKS